MRLAAIDVGSNSVHMVVADLGRDGHLEVVDRVKEMVRLGRRTFTTGRLSEESMDLAVRALKNFERLAHVRRVERMRAVATSAVRWGLKAAHTSSSILAVAVSNSCSSRTHARYGCGVQNSARRASPSSFSKATRPPPRSAGSSKSISTRKSAR